MWCLSFEKSKIIKLCKESVYWQEIYSYVVLSAAGDELFVSSILAEVGNQWEFIHPCVDNPAILLAEILNNRKQILYNIHEH